MAYEGFDPDFGLDGKVVMITGGGAGIGRSIAELFARKGATLVLLGRSASVDEAAASLGRERAMGVVADVAEADDVEAAVEEAESRAGPIDVLVNCAGVSELAPAEELSEASWDRVMAANLKGTFLMCQAVGRRMLARGRGRIVNMASQAGSSGLDKHLAYSASKGGVLSLTQVLALEWSPRGVQVNAISPTVVLTEMGRKAWAGEAGDRMKAQIPARRFAEPEEVAAAVLYLASDAAAMVTGQNLIIDGGYTAQ